MAFPEKIPTRKFSDVRVLLVCSVALAYRGGAQDRKLPASYIAVSARLDTSRAKTAVAINGVTNLPPGSVLRIEIDDYRGYRSTIFGEDSQVVVSPDGRFAVNVGPKSGLSMRANLQCTVSFLMGDQSANILRKFGKRGETLFGPQTRVNSAGTYLDAITVVTD